MQERSKLSVRPWPLGQPRANSRSREEWGCWRRNSSKNSKSSESSKSKAGAGDEHQGAVQVLRKRCEAQRTYPFSTVDSLLADSLQLDLGRVVACTACAGGMIRPNLEQAPYTSPGPIMYLPLPPSQPSPHLLGGCFVNGVGNETVDL